MAQLNARPLPLETDATNTVLSKEVVTLATELQPLVPVTVTVNVPAVVTLIEGVVAPVDHKYVPLLLTAKVVAGMAQLSASPLLFEMDAPGNVLSNVVLTLAVEVQPLAPVMVTVNIPAVVTAIHGVVAPVDHK
jgi:hypothetical protein